MSIRKDVLSRKDKAKPLPPPSKEELEEIRQRMLAEKEDERLREEKPAKFPKKLKAPPIPGEIVEAKPNEHPFGVFVDAQEGKVAIAGSKKHRKRQ